MRQVRVQIIRSEEVDQDIAARLGQDFLEWLDSVGFELRRKSGISDERTYRELAQEWTEEVVTVKGE